MAGPPLRLLFGLLVRGLGVYLVYGACQRLGGSEPVRGVAAAQHSLNSDAPFAALPRRRGSWRYVSTAKIEVIYVLHR